MAERIRNRFAAVLLAIVAGGGALAQSSERVSFAAGNDNSAIEASVTGDGYRDYVLGASAGQTMAVSLITDGNAYFNILPPGSQGEAIFIGSNEGADASVTLPADGDYTIRVHLMGDDADSGVTVPFTLSMTIM
jgi:hypothetical protein